MNNYRVFWFNKGKTIYIDLNSVTAFRYTSGGNTETNGYVPSGLDVFTMGGVLFIQEVDGADELFGLLKVRFGG